MIKVNRETLKEKLSLANLFTKKSLIQPKFSNILIQIKEKKLFIFSSNLSFFYKTEIDIEGKEKEKEIIINPEKVLEVLNLLKDNEINLFFEKNSFIVQTEKVKSRFSFSQEKDYPLPPEIKNKFELSSSLFSQVLPYILFSTSNDESKAVLTGVNILKKDEFLIFAATDGYRLSVYKIKGVNVFLEEEENIILPSDFLKIVQRVIDKKEKIKIGFDKKDKIFLIEIDNDQFFSRIIDEEFPPFEQVIPDNFNTEVILNREELFRNIKLTAIFAKDLSNVVVFDIGKKGINIYPRGDENDSSEVFQEAEVKGESIKIAFNYKFVLELLSHIKSERVLISLVKEDAPVVFKGEEEEDFIHVIMPVKISD